MQAGREIKFRALHKSGKMLFFNGDSPSFGSYPGERFASVEDVFYYHKEDFQLMQYTGLRDKNGKEIYEGDILKLPLMRPNCAVTWWNAPWLNYVLVDKLENIEKAGFGELGRFTGDDIEVIGNIYEHPELLEVGK